ncbi:MAG: tetratricopeptide repeat protein [Acidobacteriota bacterium]
MRVRPIALLVALLAILCPIFQVTAWAMQVANVETKPAVQQTDLSDWLLVNTAHFSILSNTDPERAKLIAYKLEQFREVLNRLAPQLVAATPSPTRVQVFRDGRTYNETTGLINLPTAIAGYFQPGRDLIVINDLFNISDNISYHEYTHLLTRIDDNKYPLWFVEGVALFYETFEIIGPTVRIGEVTTARLNSLRMTPFVPLRKLFAFKGYTEVLQETSLDMFYAESWLLTHYLLTSVEGKRRAQFIEFLQQLRAERPPEAAFRAAFQTDFQTMEEELKRYLEKGKFPVYVFQSDAAKIESDVDVISLTELEKSEKLADAQAATSGSPTLNLTLSRTNEAPRAAILAGLATIGDKLMPSNRPVHFSPSDPGLAKRAKEAVEQFNQGNELSEAGRIDEALAKYEQALRLDPDFAPAYMHIGNIYAQRKSFELARLAYEKARAVAPNYAGTYLNFAVMQLEQGNDVEAESSFRTAISLYPSSAAAHLGLGNIYLQRRQYERARIEYSRTLKLVRGKGPEALNAYIGLGAVYFYKGDYEQAKKQYQQAIQLDPKNSAWLRAYADNCRMLKQYEEATNYYLRAIALNAHDESAQQSLEWLRKYNEYQNMNKQRQLLNR